MSVCVCVLGGTLWIIYHSITGTANLSAMYSRVAQCQYNTLMMTIFVAIIPHFLDYLFIAYCQRQKYNTFVLALFACVFVYPIVFIVQFKYVIATGLKPSMHGKNNQTPLRKHAQLRFDCCNTTVPEQLTPLQEEKFTIYLHSNLLKPQAISLIISVPIAFRHQ